MVASILYYKTVEKNTAADLGDGVVQLVVERHPLHEVTSPQAFDPMNMEGLRMIPFPSAAFGTVDHIVPTDGGKQKNPAMNILMENRMEENCKRYGIPFFGRESGKQGIVHVIGPEMGLTHPGTVIVCGDSHTSTHGAFGAVAFGIGTTQVEHVLRFQSLSHKILKVRRIDLVGKLENGVTSKDVAINTIRQIGMEKGIGFAQEFGGPAVSDFTMEDRMSMSNMGIEGNARVTYFNPDDVTFEYLRGREAVPEGELFDKAVEYWRSFASDLDAVYDDRVEINLSDLTPTVTWGTNPGQAVFIYEPIPEVSELREDERGSAEKALRYMKFNSGELMYGKKIDIVFIGSCTNSRIPDLRVAARVLNGYKVDPNIKALAVPGSQQVKYQAEQEGLDKIFIESGVEWRDPGCSMCLGMNTDRAPKGSLIASTSNRNYENRQGDFARTILMSPGMAAKAAIEGKLSDVREHKYR